MREIKFRAWDNSKKEMLYPKKAEDMTDKITSASLLAAYNDGGLDAIMQSTGLFDKNGKEIYEGDVVEFYYLGTHRDVVRYIVDGFKVNTTGHTDDVKTELCLGFPFREMEIIGNVWENPNLIK